MNKKIIALQENESSSPPRWNNKQQSNESSEVKEFLNSSKGLVVSSVFENSK